MSPLSLIQEGRKVGRQPNIRFWNFFSCSLTYSESWGAIRYTHDPRAPKNSPKTSPDTPQTNHLFLCPHYLSSRRVGRYSASQIFAFGIFFHVNTPGLSLGGPSGTPMTPEHPKTAPKRAQIPPREPRFPTPEIFCCYSLPPSPPPSKFHDFFYYFWSVWGNISWLVFWK